jgi:hypothetical protein
MAKPVTITAQKAVNSNDKYKAGYRAHTDTEEKEGGSLLPGIKGHG